jgi:hypothetical protein
VNGKLSADPEHSFWRRYLMLAMVVLVVGSWGTASAGEAKEAARSPYVGTWKLEKLMPEPGQKWLEAKYPFIMQLLPNKDLDIQLQAPDKTIRITGTWKILPDGRLQVSQEKENGEAYEKPAIIVFSLKKGKLMATARSYVSEEEKAQAGFIFRKQ